MAHHHHHHAGHAHHYHHSTSNIQMAFWLNLSFTAIEIVGGLYTNSLAILSDALHDLGDSVALGLAWYFAKMAERPRNQRYSYGYGRFSVLGAIVNSLILIFGSLFLVGEAIPRILHPEQPKAEGMLLLAILGIAVNGAAALRLRNSTSLNEQVMSWHLLEDVLGWVAVLVASIVMMFADVPILDPLLSLAIAVYIMVNVLKGLKQSLRVVMQGTPQQLDLQALQQALLALDPRLADVHDFHIWTIDGEFHVTSFHLAVHSPADPAEMAALKHRIRHWLHEHYQVDHATIELHAADDDCEMVDNHL